MARPIITLTTDFGLRDPYVAEMKAVILNICPEATIVDVSHEIEKFNMRMAAFVLACAAPYFPKGTIHVAVVDPGVGTKRKPILIQTRNAYYIGPDNGILTLATRNDKPIQIREITNRKLVMPQISNTFHGRDIFAPTAAHIAKGTPATQVGKAIRKASVQSFSEITQIERTLVGEIIYVDDFGSIITSFGAKEMELAKVGNTIKAILGNSKLTLKICRTYANTAKGNPFIIVGSHGFVEISVSEGNAANVLRTQVGDKVTLVFG